MKLQELHLWCILQQDYIHMILYYSFNNFPFAIVLLKRFPKEHWSVNFPICTHPLLLVTTAMQLLCTEVTMVRGITNEVDLIHILHRDEVQNIDKKKSTHHQKHL